MELSIILMFAMLLTSVIIFPVDVFTVDKIASSIIVPLVLLGPATPKEAMGGASDSDPRPWSS